MVISVLAICFILPSITLATWWNPFTWNIWNMIPFFNKTIPTFNIQPTTNHTEVPQVATSIQPTDLGNQNGTTSVNENNVKTTQVNQPTTVAKQSALPTPPSNNIQTPVAVPLPTIPVKQYQAPVINIPAQVSVPALVPTPSITVISPNGGETITLGVKDVDFRTEWKSSNLTGNVDVYLAFSDGRMCLVKQNVPISQGYITSTLGNNYQCPGSTDYITSGLYKVMIDYPANSKIEGLSSNYFNITISAPTITSANYSSGKDTGIIYGSGLNDASIYFNGSLISNVNYTYVSDSQISFIMPNTNPGNYVIYVQSPIGTSNKVNLVVQ